MAELEREVGNLMKGLASVGFSPAISKAIKEREEDVERLRAQLDQIQVLSGVEIQELMIAAVKRAADWKALGGYREPQASKLDPQKAPNSRSSIPNSPFSSRTEQAKEKGTGGVGIRIVLPSVPVDPLLKLARNRGP